MIDGFYEKYSGLYNWHTQLVQTASRSGKIRIPTGRTYLFSPQRNKRGELEWPRTRILNYPVQGFAAELVKIGRVLVAEQIERDHPDCLMVSTVHDSLVVDAPKEHTEYCLNLLHDVVYHRVVEVFNQKFSYKIQLPLRGEFFYGPNQYDMEEWKHAGTHH